jgi:hypothetical protein
MWLYDKLDRGPKHRHVKKIDRRGNTVIHEVIENETPDIVPMLARLSELDPNVGYAYFCHPSVVHVFKTPHEGGFCGYRNIQTQMSWIRNARAQGYDKVGARTPGILTMQDWIEDAWDKGISSINRAETGGLRGTRKWIGASEVRASFKIYMTLRENLTVPV